MYTDVGQLSQPQLNSYLIYNSIVDEFNLKISQQQAPQPTTTLNIKFTSWSCLEAFLYLRLVSYMKDKYVPLVSFRRAFKQIKKSQSGIQLIKGRCQKHQEGLGVHIVF